MIIDPDHREVDELVVTVAMSMSQAEELSSGISDILCWMRGFMAANPNTPYEPWGDDKIRELNLVLKRKMNEAGAQAKKKDAA